ncbi:MAG: Ig-like domain-containing protein [Flavobacteriaceae bacterium]
MKNITKFMILAVFLGFGKMSFAQTVVVPNSLENTTSTGGFTGPLANTARSYQLLIHENQLTALQGQQLNGITFRPSASASSTWPASQAIYGDYDIYLSPGVAPVDRSLTFANNITGTQTQVRSGSLTIEAGSYPAGGGTTFGPVIDFTTPYTYSGGHLLVEIRHTGSNSSSKVVEAVLTTNSSLYGVAVSGCWGSGYTSTGGSQGNAAVVQFSYTGGEVVAVTDVEVSTENDVPAQITTQGGTLQLVAEITPSNATNQEIIWTVETGSEVVSIDQNGLVTALANGVATLRGTSAENETLFDEIEVTVTYVVAVVGIEVSTENDIPAEITTAGGTLQLVAEITPSDATNTEVIWTVEQGSEVATVDQNGLVTALTNGIVTIRGTSVENNTLFDEIEVMVNYVIAVTIVEVYTQDEVPAEITTIGGTLQLVAEISPAEATNSEVVWSVNSGSEVASVDPNGLVTAISDGSAVIRAAWVEDDSVFGEIEIQVNTLAIENSLLFSFTYYPNPVEDKLYLSGEVLISEITVFNILGQSVMNISLNATETEIDFSGLQSGNYLVKATTETGTAAFRIIKK